MGDFTYGCLKYDEQINRWQIIPEDEEFGDDYTEGEAKNVLILDFSPDDALEAIDEIEHESEWWKDAHGDFLKNYLDKLKDRIQQKRKVR